MKSNNIIIMIHDREQYDLLMRRLEDTGHRWKSGHLPTAWAVYRPSLKEREKARKISIGILDKTITIGPNPVAPGALYGIVLTFDEYMNKYYKRPNLNKELMGIIRGILNV